jgi:hypothetical protein
MATKQITELTLANSFDPGDLLLLRKTGQGVDQAITQQKFIETLGNPSVVGFVATSTIADQVVLTPSNDVVIDKYYDQMVVTFISPITSAGAVSIQVAGLTLKLLQELETTTTSTLVTGKYYTAVYKLSANTFYQTNLVVPYIFTNEYIAVGTVQPGETSTKYALTTAIGTPKTVTGYYPGMAALFTVNIASKGAVILNIDGLGEKSLQDPVGDDIPFNLLANEAITAIYDGTVFRKHMFSELEPIDPNPIDPPADIIVNVGPTRRITSIYDAILQLTRDHGEDGDKGRVTAIIQLDTDYADPGVSIITNTPWITVKTATAGNNFHGTIGIEGTGNINFTGIFNYFDRGTSFLVVNSTGLTGINARCTFKDATINTTSTIVQSTCLEMIARTGGQIADATVFQNVNINGFTRLCTANYQLPPLTCNFRYDTGVAVMNSATSYIVFNAGNMTLKNVNFGNVTRDAESLTALFVLTNAASFENINITTGSDLYIVGFLGANNNQSTLLNCTMRNTSTSTKPAVISASQLIIDGGDYRHPTSSSSPDIVADNYVTAVIRLRNNPLGSTGKIGKGQIINE